MKKTLVALLAGASLIGAFSLGRATKPEEQYEIRILRWPKDGLFMKEAQMNDVVISTQDSWQYIIGAGTKHFEDRNDPPVKYLGFSSNNRASRYLLKFGKNVTISVEDWIPYRTEW